jgi:signal transduction histidine kinase
VARYCMKPQFVIFTNISSCPAVSNEKPAAQDSQAPSEVDKRAANQRIEELDALVTFLHADVERHKDTLARQLHDNLSGSVIAAMMDVTWIQQHESPLTPSTETRLARIKDGLRDAIDLARRLVEELRPTLLDSIGLFAALSWQFRRGCERAGLTYTETYPEVAPDIGTTKLIGLFRVVQEAFNIVLQHESVTTIHLAVSTTNDTFSLELSDDGRSQAAGSGRMVSPAISSLLHRARNVGAEIAIAPPEIGRSVLKVSVPLVA